MAEGKVVLGGDVGMVMYDSKGRAYDEDEIAAIREELERRADRSSSTEDGCGPVVAKRLMIDDKEVALGSVEPSHRLEMGGVTPAYHLTAEEDAKTLGITIAKINRARGDATFTEVPHDLANYSDPQWHTVRSQYDWRNEVDEALREVWHTLTWEQQLRIAANFDRIMKERDWE